MRTILFTCIFLAGLASCVDEILPEDSIAIISFTYDFELFSTYTQRSQRLDTTTTIWVSGNTINIVDYWAIDGWPEEEYSVNVVVQKDTLVISYHEETDTHFSNYGMMPEVLTTTRVVYEGDLATLRYCKFLAAPKARENSGGNSSVLYRDATKDYVVPVNF